MADTGTIIQRLKAEFEKKDIRWRAQVVNQKDGSNCMALAYLDARAVMERLDSAVGPENWQTEYIAAGEGRLGCRLGIRLNGDWVWKTDGAGETDVEGEKGAFSGALKRAAVAWGVGRYLYDFPQIWVPCESYKGSNNKFMFKKFTDDPWKYCNKTVKHEAKGNTVKAKEAFKDFKENVEAAADLDTLDHYLNDDRTRKLIARFYEVIPEWAGGQGGVNDIINRRKEELSREAAE